MKKIGELLVENNIVSRQELEMALRQQEMMGHNKPIGEILVEMKIITIDSLIKYLEIQLRDKFNK